MVSLTLLAPVMAAMMALMPALAAARTDPWPIYQVSGPQPNSYVTMDQYGYPKFTYNSTAATWFYLDDDFFLRIKTKTPNELDMPVNFNDNASGRYPQLIQPKKGRRDYPLRCYPIGTSPDFECTSVGSPWPRDNWAATYANIEWAVLAFNRPVDKCTTECNDWNMPVKLAWAWDMF